MTTILNYSHCEKIFESANSLVYRGFRDKDNHAFILKMLKENSPAPEKLTHYRQEYDITRKLNIEGVINTFGLERYQNTLVMILEDFGGQSLEQLFKLQLFKLPLEISEFLELAIQITGILGEIHAANVIHKDINPSNIVLNPKTKQLKIIDFGISTILPRENLTVKNPSQLEGTLAYISPEQTGRMNRAIDYRTDFYSLGVTFYWLLTQHLPFETQDTMELVHCHLAKPPIPPHAFNSDIPPMISQLILKLLAKTAEERYQSAYGIKFDLEECKVPLHSFTLGQQDISDKLQLSQKLYGRERELETLLTAFDRANHGQSEMMLVAGYSGIGKSSLVQEIYKPITEKRGYFISGKFDQRQRNIPYSAFVNAFADLVRQLLTENQTQLTEWKSKILEAVKSNGQIIIEIIPEVELIIGKQPEVPELPPTESQNRFNLVFQNFIKVFTQPQHPLVIFLDDLQWVDSASLKLMQLLMEAPDIKALFFIGAYRDNEVSKAHPLLLTLKEIQQANQQAKAIKEIQQANQQAKAIVNQISLPPLELVHVNQLIADTLHCDLEKTYELAELVHTKTGGNPFFLNEFLKALYVEELLTFDVKQGNWQWNLAQIQARGFTDNVVDLMVEKIQQLSPNTQQALKLAACIGNQFELSTLATVLEKTRQQTATDLREAIVGGQLSIISKHLPTQIEQTTDNWALITECQFIHDRIQQAAYSLISKEQKPVVHRQIGQLLLQNTSKQEREQKIFAIVDQLNAQKLVTDAEKIQLAELNLEAGKKAIDNVAFEIALKYLSIGMAYLPTNSWKNHYKLALSLHKECAKCEYLCGNYKNSQKLLDKSLDYVTNYLDKAEIYCEQTILHANYASNPAELRQAIQFGSKGLKLLNVHLPTRLTKIHFLMEVIKAKMKLWHINVNDLNHPKQITDRKQVVLMDILMNLTVPMYYDNNENSLNWVIMKMFNISLRYGYTKATPYTYVMYGFLCLEKFSNYETAFKYGQLALKLNDTCNVTEIRAKVINQFGFFIAPWYRPLKDTIKLLFEAYQAGKEVGDFIFTGYAAQNLITHLYMKGENLENLEKKAKEYLSFLKYADHEVIVYSGLIWQHLALNFQGCLTKGQLSLTGEDFQEDQFLEKAKTNHQLQFACNQFYVVKLQLSFIYEKYEKALEYAKNVENTLVARRGGNYIVDYHFYYVLTITAILRHSSSLTSQERKDYRKTLKQHKKRLKRWAHYCEENVLHKYRLIEAEISCLENNNWQTTSNLYDEAIELADANRFLHHKALAYELAAKFYLAMGRNKIAQVYFQDAHYAYTQWGALAKVKHLEDNYSQFFQKTTASSIPTHTVTVSATTRMGVASVLDLNSILKALQAIASEMNLKLLLENLMKIVLENAGAQRGVLILKKNEEWFIEAESMMDTNEVTVLQSIPLFQPAVSGYPLSIPTTLIEYVIRIKEPVVLRDASQEGNFTRDPYIVKRQIKSVLCVPLKQKEVTGILYLENNLAIDAFTSERVEVLKLLSLQIAISIENARHYTKMKN